METITIYILIAGVLLFIGYLYGSHSTKEDMRHEIKMKEIELGNKEVKIERKAKQMVLAARKVAEEQADQVLKEKTKEIKQKEKELEIYIKELQDRKKKIETVIKIVKAKNWKHLRNLALSAVSKERIKAETMKANRELIYVQDLLNYIPEKQQGD